MEFVLDNRQYMINIPRAHISDLKESMSPFKSSGLKKRAALSLVPLIKKSEECYLPVPTMPVTFDL
jgi:hypothetical protein